MEFNSFEMVRNANVEVEASQNSKGSPIALITVDDKYQHSFPATSRVSQHLNMMSADQLGQRLSGGAFFFVDDLLVDFRDGDYGNGFIQDDDTIALFMDVLGCTETYNRRAKETAVELRKRWSEETFQVNGFGDGGIFNGHVSYDWSPFKTFISTAIEVIRQVCTNGAMAMSPLFKMKVQLVNREHEHLDIASRQMHNKLQSVMDHRVQRMSVDRASVADCMLAARHCHDRLKNGFGDRDDFERMKRLRNAASPEIHLSDFYTSKVFDTASIAAQAPSHLTVFDLYNIVTELRSHTAETHGSSSYALNKLANTLLFDQEVNTAKANSLTGPKKAAFSNTDQAFFGQVA